MHLDDQRTKHCRRSRPITAKRVQKSLPAVRGTPRVCIIWELGPLVHVNAIAGQDVAAKALSMQQSVFIGGGTRASIGVDEACLGRDCIASEQERMRGLIAL